jgi:hypothetical protein
MNDLFNNKGQSCIDKIIEDLSIDLVGINEVIKDISIGVLFFIYCCPEKKFGFDNFRSNLERYDISMKNINNLYRICERFRESAGNDIGSPTPFPSSSPSDKTNLIDALN